MSIELYASLPNEVLYLVWINIDPLLKYSLNKENLNKYYSYCNNNIHFNNYNYYYYLIKHDLLIFSELVLKTYIEKLVVKKHNTIYYKNLSFYSLIDFFHYYSTNNNNSNSSNNSNSNKKTKDFIIQIINKYNLTHLIKKIHKNNVNKNIRWNI